MIANYFISEGLMTLEWDMQENARQMYNLEIELFAQGALKDKPKPADILKWPIS